MERLGERHVISFTEVGGKLTNRIGTQVLDDLGAWLYYTDVSEENAEVWLMNAELGYGWQVNNRNGVRLVGGAEKTHALAEAASIAALLAWPPGKDSDIGDPS